jgi:predicted GNAT superfamily acetyltransferase
MERQPEWYEQQGEVTSRSMLARIALRAAPHCNAWQACWRGLDWPSRIDLNTYPKVIGAMLEWKIDDRHFLIRDVEGEAEHHAVEDIQKEAWGFNDLDTVPAATLMATQHAGGVVLGAFERDKMIGFAYGFAAWEDRRASLHSHMLAVRPEYRNFQAGFYLKLAQREAALAKGLDEITWTFDPLQSLNAHLNFAKLGVTSRRYIVNFYGEATSSPLHQGFGTDRLWVRWLLNSDRVARCLPSETSRGLAKVAPGSTAAADIIQSALIHRDGSRPLLGDFSGSLAASRCAIEIPHNINALKEREPKLGSEWREATRAAFLAAIEAGFLVEDFVRIEGDLGPRWFYSLSK